MPSFQTSSTTSSIAHSFILTKCHPLFPAFISKLHSQKSDFLSGTNTRSPSYINTGRFHSSPYRIYSVWFSPLTPPHLYNHEDITYPRLTQPFMSNQLPSLPFILTLVLFLLSFPSTLVPWYSPQNFPIQIIIFFFQGP